MGDIESTRIAFAEALTELAEKDPNITLVCADSTKVVKVDAFIERFP